MKLTARVALSTVVIAVVALCAMLCPGVALAAFTPPPMQDAVTDTAGKLTPADDVALEATLAAYRKRTGNEIAVLVTGSLGGESVEDVAYKTFNTWHIGQKDKDNGVLLVIAPTERKARIETGKGVGDRLTDVECSHILRDRVTPQLKAGRYRAAIEAGEAAIEAALDGRPAPALTGAARRAAPARSPSRGTGATGSSSTNLPVVYFFAFLGVMVGGIIFYRVKLAPKDRRRRRGRRGGSSSSYASSTDYSSSSSSSDYSSSSSDSGYTGGGGESGGGGASDSW